MIISSVDGILRDIQFHQGVNLIIDKTDVKQKEKTGNNVGKTTVLKLVDFCLGADKNIIYNDTESKKKVYAELKEYLIRKEVLIKMVMVDDIENPESKRIVIERNFLSNSAAIRSINGDEYMQKEFVPILQSMLFPNHKKNQPKLKSIMAHNIRYKDIRINNTLKMLNAYKTVFDYEMLYLFLLGCDTTHGEEREKLRVLLTSESDYKKRLESKQTKSGYETALQVVLGEIRVLNEKKSNLNLCENLEEKLNELNNINMSISGVNEEISKLEIKKSIIEEAQDSLANKKSEVDTQQLRTIYGQAKKNIDSIQRKFEDLVNYHNQMLDERSRYVARELPEIETRIRNEKNNLDKLLTRENKLKCDITSSGTFDDLEHVMTELNEKHVLKGEYEMAIKQIEDAEDKITALEDQLDIIDNGMFSEAYEKKVKDQVNKFNEFFASISNEFYNETYVLKYDILVHQKTKRQYYYFSSFNANMSSGKKQGEILCFDLAYLLFAESQNMDQLHFLLNDKKELMHGNQLQKLAQFIDDKPVQLVFSMLEDKLPKEFKSSEHVILELSQDSKLFRMEEFK